MFNPGVNIGDSLTNDELRQIFKCGNMGGMRRSKETGTLVIISDHTKGFYDDVWRDGILYYTGMGKSGDQVLEGNQNKTLYDSEKNGVEVHLFEVLEKTVVKLSSVELNRSLGSNHDNREPKTIERTEYYRSPYLKELVKRIANGKCQ